MSVEFAYTRPGLAPELNALTLDELVHHYCMYLNDFSLDDNLCAAYFNRFIAEPNLKNHAQGTKCFIHLMRKAVQLIPFNADIRNIYSQIFASPEDKAKASVLAQQTVEDSFSLHIKQMQDEGKVEAIHSLLCRKIKKENGNIALAEMLLEFSMTYNFPLSTWLHHFTPHPLLKKDWDAYLIAQIGANGQAEENLQLWEATQSTEISCGDIALNFAAVSYASMGDADTARKLYMQSLSLDPTQTPIKNLIGEMDDPFTVNTDALTNNPVPILIYSYNKASLLKATLESVCTSEIGESDIIVLLNGCSDGSHDVVQQAQATYPNCSIELLDIPINMGAPAARNYLLDHVRKTREFNYLAYLDDDVTMPANWLQSLVTAMDSDPQIGAVGCRILTPGENIQQYLYRNVSVAKPGTFRLGWSSPRRSRSVGMYEVRRNVDSVMGCCHLIRKECFDSVPNFDIQFSPSQLDDVAFHLDLVLNGWKVHYLGNLECMHDRATGFGRLEEKVNGSALGNDVKFYYRFREQMDPFLKKIHQNTASFMDQMS